MARIMGKEEVLLSLHRSPAHGGQIEAWQMDLKAFDELKADYEEELRRVRGEAYQVATLYAVFQGVIFTAISQANLLSCKLWWCPVALSVAVTLAAFLAIADKLYSMGEVTEDIKEMSANMSALVDYLDKIEEEGAQIDLDAAQPFADHQREKQAGYYFILSRDGISALLFLTCFSLLIICFSYKSLCIHCGACAIAPSPSPSAS